MKNYFFIFLTLLSFSVFSQVVKTNVVTTYVSSDEMIWNETKNEWDFNKKYERQRKSNTWALELFEDLTGGIIMTDLKDGEKFILSVYSWTFNTENETLMIETIENSTGNNITVIIKKRNEMEYLIACMIPQMETALYFDNFKQ